MFTSRFLHSGHDAWKPNVPLKLFSLFGTVWSLLPGRLTHSSYPKRRKTFSAKHFKCGKSHQKSKYPRKFVCDRSVGPVGPVRSVRSPIPRRESKLRPAVATTTTTTTTTTSKTPLEGVKATACGVTCIHVKSMIFGQHSSEDTVSEWLRRWTRNPFGSARRGSNPLGVVFTATFPFTYPEALIPSITPKPIASSPFPKWRQPFSAKHFARGKGTPKILKKDVGFT